MLQRYGLYFIYPKKNSAGTGTRTLNGLSAPLALKVLCATNCAIPAP